MNQDNFEYLKKQIKYSGFGDLLEFALKDEMEKGQDKFQLKHTADFGTDQVQALLNFKKSEQGIYFFNNYDMILSKIGKEDMKQTFYINRPVQAVREGQPEKEWINSTLTFKEAYNLMDGRSVLKDFTNKQDQVYASWVSLDFKNTDKYGNFELKHKGTYDLGAKLDTFPIKGLDNPATKQQILDSLQKGNLHPVIMLHNGNEVSRSIAANPQFKGVHLFERGVRVSAAETQTQAHAETPDQKNSQKNRESEKTIKKRSRKQGVNG